MVLNLFTRAFWRFLCSVLAGGYFWTVGVQAYTLDGFTRFRMKTLDHRYVSTFMATNENDVVPRLVTSLPNTEADEFVYDPCSLNLRRLSDLRLVILPKPMGVQDAKQAVTELICQSQSECKLWVRYTGKETKSYLATYKYNIAELSVTDLQSNTNCDDFIFQLEIMGTGVRNPPELKMPWSEEKKSICFLPKEPSSYSTWTQYFNLHIKSRQFKLCIPLPHTWETRKNLMLKNGMATDSRMYVIPTKDANKEFQLKLKELVETSNTPSGRMKNEKNFGKLIFTSVVGPDTVFQIASNQHEKVQAFIKQRITKGMVSFKSIPFAFPKLTVDNVTREFLNTANMNHNSKSSSLLSNPGDVIEDVNFRTMLNRGQINDRRMTVASHSMYTPVDVYFVSNGFTPNFRELRSLENAAVHSGYTHLPAGPIRHIPRFPAYEFSNIQASLGTYAAGELFRFAPHAHLIPFNMGAHYDTGDVFKAIETIIKLVKKSNTKSVVYLPLYTLHWEEDHAGLLAFAKYLKKVIQSLPRIPFVVVLREEHVAVMGSVLHDVVMLSTSTTSPVSHDDKKSFSYHLFSTPATFRNTLLLKDAPLGKPSITECFSPIVIGAKVAGIVVHDLQTHKDFNENTKATDLFRYAMDTAYKYDDKGFLAHSLSHLCPSKKGPFTFTWKHDKNAVYDCHQSSEKTDTFVDEPEIITQAERTVDITMLDDADTSDGPEPLKIKNDEL